MDHEFLSEHFSDAIFAVRINTTILRHWNETQCKVSNQSIIIINVADTQAHSPAPASISTCTSDVPDSAGRTCSPNSISVDHCRESGLRTPSLVSRIPSAPLLSYLGASTNKHKAELPDRAKPLSNPEDCP